jgi:alcohol dehydrogenase class IV
MIQPFEFATAQQILFGVGLAARLPELARSLGKRVLVVTGSNNPDLAPPVEALFDAGLVSALVDVSGEPSVPQVLTHVATARQHDCDLVVAIGGGSAIDTAKAVAALLTNPGDPLDYLEVVGHGRPLTAASAPVIAVPTTSGTGAEVTRNAVLAVPEQKVKVSLRSPTMLPRIALVDPALTYSLPAAITASTGLDALTQCIEPFVSSQANPLSDAVAREGMVRAARSLQRAVRSTGDAEARADMAMASLCGGLALANAKLGAVHGFAGVLGGMFPIPHGIVCARLLPFVLEANVAALVARGHDPRVRARFDEVARLVTGDVQTDASAGVAWVHRLCVDLAVPGLGAFGVEPSDFAEVVAKSQQSSSMKGNPIPLQDEELYAILEQAL